MTRGNCIDAGAGSMKLTTARSSTATPGWVPLASTTIFRDTATQFPPLRWRQSLHGEPQASLLTSCTQLVSLSIARSFMATPGWLTRASIMTFRITGILFPPLRWRLRQHGEPRASSMMWCIHMASLGTTGWPCEKMSRCEKM